MQSASYPCCGHPELSVLFSGEICGISDSQIFSWLPSISSIPFCHIVKKTENRFGHVHFINQENTNRFYHLMIGDRFEFSSGIFVKFFASKHFDTKRKVAYGTRQQLQQMPRQQLLYPHVQQPQRKQRQPQPPKQQRRLHQQLLQPYIQPPQQQQQQQHQLQQRPQQQRQQQRQREQHQPKLRPFLQRQQQTAATTIKAAQQQQTTTTVLECNTANGSFVDQFNQ